MYADPVLRQIWLAQALIAEELDAPWRLRDLVVQQIRLLMPAPSLLRLGMQLACGCQATCDLVLENHQECPHGTHWLTYVAGRWHWLVEFHGVPGLALRYARTPVQRIEGEWNAQAAAEPNN